MSEPAKGPIFRYKVHLGNGRAGHRKIREGPKPGLAGKADPRVARIARLLALAHHFDGLLRKGIVRNLTEISRLMKVTRAWVTNIMNLLLLAPDIQEEILFLTAESERKQPATMRTIRRVVAEPEWRRQRALWHDLRRRRLESVGLEDGEATCREGGV